MHNSARLILATQFYPPDTSTTAVYLGQIADTLAMDNQVVVISAAPNLDSPGADRRNNPAVIEIRNWNPRKSALVQRAAAACLLAAPDVFWVLTRARSSDVVFCVTSPFTLPYTVLLAAKLRGAATLLLIYDLYPEALEAAGLIHSRSFAARLIRFANTPPVSKPGRHRRHRTRCAAPPPEVSRRQTGQASHHSQLAADPDRISRDRPIQSFPRSGCLPNSSSGYQAICGFTHSPATVFEAARLLELESDIHFILSGWGVGWRELNDRVRTAKAQQRHDPEPGA